MEHSPQDYISKPFVYINPPPPDMCCECCGRNIHVCPEFPDGKRGIIKDFRDNGGCIGAYWVCRLCLSLDDGLFWRMFNTNKVIPFAEWLKEKNLTDDDLTVSLLAQYRVDCKRKEKKGA